MKNIARNLFLLVMALTVTFTAYSNNHQKKRVVVDYFYGSRGLSTKYIDMIRASVLTALSSSGRVYVINAVNETALKLSENITEASAIPTEDNILRQNEMIKQGATLQITGTVTNISYVRQKGSDGKYYYTGVVNFSLDVMDLTNGMSIGGRNFSYSGLNARSGSTPDVAITETIKGIGRDMSNFINDHFKVPGQIIQIEEVKKNSAKVVYVNLGQTFGIKKGQLFTIYEVRSIAGQESKKEVGKLVADEVEGPSLTKCKVSKGGEIIFEASKDPEKIVLIVETARKRIGFGELMGV